MNDIIKALREDGRVNSSQAKIAKDAIDLVLGLLDLGIEEQKVDGPVSPSLRIAREVVSELADMLENI